MTSHPTDTNRLREFRLAVTLGPKSFDSATALVRSGATELRLNASHMCPVEVSERCIRLRRELPGVRLVVDLQGKKMRLGVFSPFELHPGQVVLLLNHSDTVDGIPVPHAELFSQATVGEHLSLDDGKLELQVTALGVGRLEAKVLRGGLLQPRKGINRLEHPVRLGDLTPADQRIVELCAETADVDFAVSFAEDGSESAWIRRRAPNRRVILKIERQEAIERLPQLAAAGDELWICRGDLGEQLGYSRMARAIAALEPRQHPVPILMAGQVLQHLSEHPVPTRSEICHLHDLLNRGYAGIVLSDETAIGCAPLVATEWAARLMRDILAEP